MKLPVFRYHPDPVETGMVVPSGVGCVVCGETRGYVYSRVPSGPELVEPGSICPWCISDGSAHEKLGVEFVDGALIGHEMVGSGPVPREVAEEIVYRTPGFLTWQGDYWFTHCGDGAQFLGSVGVSELREAGPEAVAVIRASIGDTPDAEEYFEGLERNGSPSAYLFRCLHCGQFGGYTDMD